MFRKIRFNTTLLVLGLGISFILQQHRASAVRILKREVGGCMCSDFTYFRKKTVGQGPASRRGYFLGGCRTRDEHGDEFCYVHQPNNCTDARPFKNFIGMDISAIACSCKFNRFGQCSTIVRDGTLATSDVKTENGNKIAVIDDFEDNAQ